MASPNVSGIMAQLIPDISAGKENIATEKQKRIPYNPGLHTSEREDIKVRRTKMLILSN